MMHKWHTPEGLRAVKSPFDRVLSPTEVTLDAPSNSNSAEKCVGAACRIHLVQGSDSGRTGETESLLRWRLRTAALLLFAGFAAFFVWHTIRVQFDSWPHVLLYAAHLACTLIFAAIGWALASDWQPRARRVRAR